MASIFTAVTAAPQYQSVIVDPTAWSSYHQHQHQQQRNSIDDEDSQSITSTSSSQDESSTASVESGEDILATAMLKEEIRCNIMKKRVHKGLGTINAANWKKSSSDNLTADEEAKRKTRRERNRLAASRCRERRREKTYVLVKETEELDSSNRELLEEIRQLEVQRQQLVSFMESHKLGRCECAQQALTADDLIIDP